MQNKRVFKSSIPKQLLENLAVHASGAIQHSVSALTGQLTAYFPVYHEIIYDHQSVLDPIALAGSFTNDIYDAGYDGYVDNVTIIEGAIVDTMIPSTWIAEIQPNATTGRMESLFVAGNGNMASLFGEVLVSLIIIIAELIAHSFLIKLTIVLIAAAFACYASPMLRVAIYGDPNQYVIPGQGYKTWDQAQSYYNANYWYVCDKNPSIAVGLKATADASLPGPRYSSAAGVPQTEVTAWSEACNRAADIKPGGTDWFMTIGILAVLGVGAYVLVNVLRFLPRGKRED